MVSELELEQAVNLAIAMNRMFGRSDLAEALGQTSHSGARDYYKVLGYQKNIPFQRYNERYQRQDIAGRIVDLPATDTWRKTPRISEPGLETSPFLTAWDTVSKTKHIFSALTRADRISGIGRYGVLYIGFKGQGTPADPVEPGSVSGPEGLLFLRPFIEGQADIETWVEDSQNPRFGLPNTYTLEVDHGDSIEVHHTRILHLAEGKLTSDVYGTPRLQRVFNRLDDLIKVVGGSAEASWLNMRPGTIITTQPGYSIDDSTEASREREREIQEYIHGISRIMTMEGVDAKQLTSQMTDPTNPFEVILSLISAASGIPQRVLLGSAAGELASAEEDTKQWFGAIESRQLNYAEPEILRPFVDHLIKVGVLPEPQSGTYEVSWPPLFQTSATELAQISLTRAQAIAALVDPVSMQLPATSEQIAEILGLVEGEGLSEVAQMVRRNYREGTLTHQQYIDWLELELEAHTAEEDLG